MVLLKYLRNKNCLLDPRGSFFSANNAVSYKIEASFSKKRRGPHKRYVKGTYAAHLWRSLIVKVFGLKKDKTKEDLIIYF